MSYPSEGGLRAAGCVPVIFWHSDPLQPGETLSLCGEFFSADAVVEYCRLSDDAQTREEDAPLPESWREAERLLAGPQTLMAAIPANERAGVYACRVRNGDGLCSDTVLVNAPDAWWAQGDEGRDAARVGGWLRVLGKCLDWKSGARLCLAAAGEERMLEPEEASSYSLRFAIPADLSAGTYEARVYNGHGDGRAWRRLADIQILPAFREPQPVLNVLDFGADPEGRKDCTLAIIQGLEHLGGLGGGVLYFPHGRYRIDSILRSGMWIATPLRIPRGVTLRGAGAGLTSLWWPDHAEPLPSLIETGSEVTIEDLGIYTQGRHRNIITCEADNVRLRRLRIRANCYYMTNDNGRSHHRRTVTESAAKMGWAIELCGRNLQVCDCDIYTSAGVFFLRHVEGGLIGGNRSRGGGHFFVGGNDGTIFEHNEFSGNSLTTGGSGLTLFFGATTCRHFYFAHNHTSHLYGGDHEALTLDGHGTAYFGRVARADGTSLTLARDPVLGQGARDALVDLHGTYAYILYGRGRGQYRRLVGANGREIDLDRAWQVAPDESSVVLLGAFNGRHLFIGNTMQDTGTVIQLYPPNFECIVAENRAVHASNFNCVSKLGRSVETPFQRVEPSWFNQFLDNRVVMGNGWGAGETEIDRWIGGESTLNIWGWQVAFEVDADGCDQDRQLTPDDLRAMLDSRAPAQRTIPLTIFPVVRRHVVENNSSIRLRAAVSDALVEGCELSLSARGIRVDNEVIKEHVADLGQLAFEPPQTVSRPEDPAVFLSPERVLVRNNRFREVGRPYEGTALREALIIPEGK